MPLSIVPAPNGPGVCGVNAHLTLILEPPVGRRSAIDGWPTRIDRGVKPVGGVFEPGHLGDELLRLGRHLVHQSEGSLERKSVGTQARRALPPHPDLSKNTKCAIACFICS